MLVVYFAWVDAWASKVAHAVSRCFSTESSTWMNLFIRFAYPHDRKPRIELFNSFQISNIYANFDLKGFWIDSIWVEGKRTQLRIALFARISTKQKPSVWKSNFKFDLKCHPNSWKKVFGAGALSWNHLTYISVLVPSAEITWLTFLFVGAFFLKSSTPSLA